ncbi:MAG: hypothetical protein AAF961_16350, partial [Planctomycetota bacterium]
MVVDRQILPYFEWLFTGGPDQTMGALPRYLLVLLGVGLLLLLIGYAIAAARRGLLRGGDVAYRTVSNGIVELLQTKWRRVWAIARLSMKEAWRRRVVVALAVFLVVLLFANWYLGVNHQEPARLYLSFVLTATTYLVLGVALLLSAFSLPHDFSTKTIYTVVTKPVRAGEIVLGRMVGFIIVGTLLLVFMGVCSYIFVVRSLDHVHGVEIASLEREETSTGLTIITGRLTESDGHRHGLEFDAESPAALSQVTHGHAHEIDVDGETYRVGEPEGFIQARVPAYGELRFIDRQGLAKDTGISVGNEWNYRSFIDGNTQATAIWTFDNIDESELFEDEGNQYLPLAIIVRVFRTHKGIIGRPILGSIQLRRPVDPDNPERVVASEPIPFEALDAQVDEKDVPRELLDVASGEEIDLIDDLVDE